MARGIGSQWRYDEARLQNRLWTPAELSPLLWLDAADLSSISVSGSGVSQWRDKSGYELHFGQSTDGQRPALVTADGLPAILFDGSNDNLTANATAQIYAYPLTVLILASASSLASSTYNTLFDSYQDNNGTIPGHAQFIKSNGKSAVYMVSTTGQPNYDGTGALTYTANTPILFATSIADSLIRTFGNGVADGAPSLSFTGRTTPVGGAIYVGAGVRFNRYTPWTMREVLMISTIGTAARQQCEGYMLWKRGLQNLLPASHPFANRPPLIGG